MDKLKEKENKNNIFLHSDGFFFKLGIRSKHRLIRWDQSHRPLAGARLKPEQVIYGLSPLKLAPEGIEPKTFGGANSKIPNQPILHSDG